MDFITSNELDLKSVDGTTESIYLESGNKKLFLKLMD